MSDTKESDRYRMHPAAVYEVSCPHCGADEGGQCRHTDADGPTTEHRQPHQERWERAEEIWRQLHTGSLHSAGEREP